MAASHSGLFFNKKMRYFVYGKSFSRPFVFRDSRSFYRPSIPRRIFFTLRLRFGPRALEEESGRVHLSPLWHCTSRPSRRAFGPCWFFDANWRYSASSLKCLPCICQKRPSINFSFSFCNFPLSSFFGCRCPCV